VSGRVAYAGGNSPRMGGVTVPTSA
jgi:hypothetical protein